jgi:hypothetical protein
VGYFIERLKKFRLVGVAFCVFNIRNLNIQNAEHWRER